MSQRLPGRTLWNPSPTEKVTSSSAMKPTETIRPPAGAKSKTGDLTQPVSGLDGRNLQQLVGEIPARHKSESEYRLTDALPQELKTRLPTIEELEGELRNVKPQGGEHGAE